MQTGPLLPMDGAMLWFLMLESLAGQVWGHWWGQGNIWKEDREKMCRDRNVALRLCASAWQPFGVGESRSQPHLRPLSLRPCHSSPLTSPLPVLCPAKSYHVQQPLSEVLTGRVGNRELQGRVDLSVLLSRFQGHHQGHLVLTQVIRPLRSPRTLHIFMLCFRTISIKVAEVNAF